jgi:biotin carboxyl carrier protein
VRYRITVEGRTFEIRITPQGQVWVNDRPVDVDLESINGQMLYSLLVEHRSYEAHVQDGDEPEREVAINGHTYQVSLQGAQDPGPAEEVEASLNEPAEIAAPLAGRLLEMRVKEGQDVEAGEVVAVMESMKMHIELRAPRAGAAQSVCANIRREISQGELLAIIYDAPQRDAGA